MKTFNVYNNNNKAVQEAYEMLTASIHILNNQNKLKALALTSCNPGEGKTSLAINLAVSMAQAGWRVLLVDADMRKPTAAKRLNEGKQIGLTDYLTGDVELADAISETNVSNLTYLSSGSDKMNPVELLCSSRFDELMDKLRTEYDFILFDTPALETVVDGTIIASKVDATLIVVKMDHTTLKSLVRAKEKLESLNVNILGVILNKMKKRDYKRYFNSYNYFFNTKRFLKEKSKRNIPLDEGNPKSIAKM